ncbi:DUF4919 domain-containing protein [Pseudidiomarina mangrovi]|uniref:DUF4919 domain-containing protein n=1 Tax=Pseudidiomarina mangrovi TaxID=2487133 RepID=UPI000FC9F788|nr:DUF4919 domain-containing protein [Pseudidiomarina mangrovi]CAI8159471.1 MAG: Uncharacterised protein [Pseudidiomarina mangrovi]
MINVLRPIQRWLVLSVSLFLAACASVQDPASSASELAATAEYEQQIAWIKSADSQADFAKLRESFTRTASYRPYIERSVDDAIELFEQQQFAECLVAVEKVLARQYGHLQGHFLAMVCHRELGNNQQADFHDSVVRGLLASIDSSGDGSSVATAMTTYDMQELYSYLEFMGLKPVSQALISDNDRWYDVMTVTYEDEQREFDLYFDITRQFTRGFK